MSEKTAAHRDALKRRLADVRLQIEIAQRAPVDPRVATAAIDQARRDQDALTSPVLEDLRETAEKLATDIEHAWISLCRTTAMADTLAAKAPTVTVPASLPAAITAAAAIRDQLKPRTTNGPASKPSNPSCLSPQVVGCSTTRPGPPPARNSVPEAAVRIDRARGERSADYTPPATKKSINAAALAPRALRPQWNAWFDESERSDTPVEAPAAIQDIRRQWKTATVTTLTPTAALAAHPHPVVDPAIDPEHPLARILAASAAARPIRTTVAFW